jgi:hypothetical protein
LDISSFLLVFVSNLCSRIIEIFVIMFSSLINTSVVGLALVAAVNGAGPDISGVGINSYTHGGSACPQGSTDFAINVDATR